MCCALGVIALLLIGLIALVIALMVIAWPATNPPAGSADNWLVAAPYLIASAFLLVTSAYLFWLGFCKTNSSHSQHDSGDQ